MKVEETKDKGPGPENAWKLFTDEASSSGSSGAGLMFVSPEGKEYTYALRFEFETTKNEAEYEALLAGLRIATAMKIQDLATFVDSQLVANHEKGLFERWYTKSQSYRGKWTDKVKEERDNWMLPIKEYLQLGILPSDPRKAKKIQTKAPQYIMINDKPYRKSYMSSWMRCIGPIRAKRIIQEKHQGSYVMHAWLRSVVSRITKQVYIGLRFIMMRRH
uniref:RNase H type-1 domain-containing protein n=1 Tax=Tanacetum cinerariifolium TaxID=118510 RepID=A0A6L2M699_TANCI|nr:hypothetical protein [Tanacetum cinerariifolium]